MSQSSSALSDRQKSSQERLKRVVFLSSVAGMSVFGGFAFAIAMAKKKDPKMFSQGFLGSKGMTESGSSLAMRALGWGTLYSVCGVSAVCCCTCLLLGVRNLDEFREKMQSFMPRIPRNEPQGRTEFNTFRELFEFLSQEPASRKKDE